MAIRTGQYTCLLLSASLYILLNRFKVDTKAFFMPSEAGRAFLNQARAWFLRIASVRERLYVCVCLRVSAPEAINN